MKLIVVGVPACYFGLNPILMLMGIPSILPDILVAYQYGILSTISGLVLGYVILDSLIKDNPSSV